MHACTVDDPQIPAGLMDLEQVPNNLGTARLRMDTGALISSTGQMDSPAGVEAAQALYHILLDTGVVLRKTSETLRRISVQFKGVQYVLTASPDEVYIVKKTADDPRG